MGAANWFSDAVKSLTPRCAEKISDAFSFAASPFTGALDYMAETGAKGEARSMRGLAEKAWGGDGKGLLDFKVGRKVGEDGKVLDEGMTLNGGKIAATAGGLGLGYRGLSGGGLYRDKDGNTDIAGVPFV